MEQISGYKLIDKIGEGGMATVYKGLQVSLNRDVAIKVLSKKLAARSDMLELFKRESLIIARLSNPNIIHVIDRGITPEGMPYFVMEFVAGTDLARVIQAGSLDFNRKLELVIQVCKALSYAHKNGIIHRDIKPANVLIDGEGNARVLDFGIAQFYGEEDAKSEHTRSGMLMGTVAYMSPEQQSAAGNITVLSDLYSLGVLMYELFTGLKPQGRFRLPSQVDPALPKSLEKVIMQCLEPEPANRLASADEVKDRLLKLLRGAHLETAQKERATRGITSVKDKFALLDIIKDGHHGAVYLYEEKVNHNLLVIKKCPSKGTGFIEAKLLTSLKHKNIVNILGVSRNEQLFIIVMEYLTGGSLKDRLIKPFPVAEFLRTAKKICEGLSFAHRNRIIHGNLRPSNILFSGSGQVKVTDFGIDEHYAGKEGTVNWYNISGAPKSQSTDILASGVVFYQMLTGSLPEWADSQLARNPNFDQLPPRLQEMVTGMLMPDHATRRKSFDQVIAEIDTLLPMYMGTAGQEAPTELLGDETISAGPSMKAWRRTARRIVLIALVLLVLCAVAAVYVVRSGDRNGYMAMFLNIWERVADYLEPLLKKIRSLAAG